MCRPSTSSSEQALGFGCDTAIELVIFNSANGATERATVRTLRPFVPDHYAGEVVCAELAQELCDGVQEVF